MGIVLQAIWEFRSLQGGQRVKLNHLELERYAEEIRLNRLKVELQAENIPHRTEKPIRRQNWYNLEAIVEWQAIRRAIDGLEPLNGHEEIEKAIASFGAADSQKVIAARIAELQAALDECRNKLKVQTTTFDEFKRKAYGDQYVEGRFKEEYEHYKQQYENYIEQASKDETLRKQLDAELTKLRSENKELKRLMDVSTNVTDCGNVFGKPKLFIPDIKEINAEGTDSDLIEKYRALKTESFLVMMKEAARKAPDEIFLVFHRFNIDISKYIRTGLPYSKNRLTYVFACYEPVSEKRHEFFINAAKKSTVKPRVFLVLGEPTTPNVIPLQADPGVEERLRSKAKAMMFRPYNLDEESYVQVSIKRV